MGFLQFYSNRQYDRGNPAPGETPMNGKSGLVGQYAVAEFFHEERQLSGKNH